MAAKKAATKKGKRYSDEEKAKILAYAEAQGRGGQSAAAKKFGVSPLTISSWKKGSSKTTGDEVHNGRSAQKPDRDAVLRQLAEKGFKIVRLQNALTGETIEEKIDPKIEKLGLDFKGLPAKPSDSASYVSVSGSKILVTVTLDRLLALTGTKP